MSRPKRHCMVVHAYYPLGETRVEREALALTAAGWEVDVLCLRDAGELAEEMVDGVRVMRLPARRGSSGGMGGQVLEYLRFFALAFARLAALQPRRRYAAVQAHNLPDFLVFAALPARLGGARLLLDIHDIMPEFMAARTGKPMSSLPVRLTILQEQLACRFADAVITVTELWRQRLASRGTPAEKISVVMNLADERVFHPVPLAERPPRRSPRFHLVYHGTFKQRYGMDVLIQAADIARRELPDLLVTLQGVGDYAPEMAEMIARLGLQDTVILNDFTLPTAELPGLIYQADLGVVPNYEDLFTGELLPTKLLEYAALGVPAIAARTRVIGSYFDERMVRFFTPGDAASLAGQIVRAYRERAALPEQARQMERFTARYNWTAEARRYVQLVERLTGGARASTLSEEPARPAGD